MSPVEAVSLSISESTGALRANESSPHLSKTFRWWFSVDIDSVFLDYFLVDRGYMHWRIHTSPVEAISVMICESAATQFTLTISDSTGALCTDESKRHLWKRFRWWFLSRHWLSFPWLFLSQQAVCVNKSRHHLWKQFHSWFLSRQQLSFCWLFLSQQWLC